jgi:hypothetical protein
MIFIGGIIILVAIIIVFSILSNIMEPKTSAKDFFLHLGAIVFLYSVAISFVNLVWTVVNKAYPAVSQNYFYGGYNPYDISLPVATLIISFPIFILLSWLLNKSYMADPSRKEIWVRRWLIYITLFVAGLIFAGDLVAVLYKFLSGEDFTIAFFLKALTILVVTGFVFGYYLQDVRGRMESKMRKTWGIVSFFIIAAAIITGFSIIGSPKTQRLIRYDNQKVNDLQMIQSQVTSRFQRTGELPQSIADINDELSGYRIPADPQTNNPYEYRATSKNSFQLCATFNREPLKVNASNGSSVMPTEYGVKGASDFWNHGVGRQCFDRTIDESLYPVYKPIPASPLR